MGCGSGSKVTRRPHLFLLLPTRRGRPQHLLRPPLLPVYLALPPFGRGDGSRRLRMRVMSCVACFLRRTLRVRSWVRMRKKRRTTSWVHRGDDGATGSSMTSAPSLEAAMMMTSPYTDFLAHQIWVPAPLNLTSFSFSAPVTRASLSYLNYKTISSP